MNNNLLHKALDELDSALAKKKLELDILICGAFAIQILGFKRGTEIQAAIKFLRESNSPPKNASSNDLSNFRETICDLKSLV